MLDSILSQSNIHTFFLPDTYCFILLVFVFGYMAGLNYKGFVLPQCTFSYLCLICFFKIGFSGICDMTCGYGT